jgi:hypothetical protein
VFIKVTHAGPRSYVQLVETYRDEAGRPKQRRTQAMSETTTETITSSHSSRGQSRAASKLTLAADAVRKSTLASAIKLS